METFAPKYRRNPNEKVHSLYAGVAPGGRTVVRLVKPSLDRNRMEATRTYGPGIPRGQGGMIGVLILGGMETTLDEMEYILEAQQERKFVPDRTGGEVAQMCRMVIERRNERIRYLRKNPSEAPKPKKKPPIPFYLPAGFRYVPTPEPGLSVLAQV